jgi:hypothetical protein
VKMKRALLWLVLLVGCSICLTLLSCLYVRVLEPTFFGRAPYSRELQYGFPLPVLTAQQWIGETGYHDVLFMWEGALLDMTFYALAGGIVFRIGSDIIETVKTRTVKEQEQAKQA